MSSNLASKVAPAAKRFIKIGDLVEARKITKSFTGIVCNIIPSSKSNGPNPINNTQGQSIIQISLPNGYITNISNSDISYTLPAWAYSSFISIAPPLNEKPYVSMDSSNRLDRNQIPPAAATFHLLQFLKVTEGNSKHERFALVYDHFIRDDEESVYVDVKTVAEFVFCRKANIDTGVEEKISPAPTQAHLLSTFRFLNRNTELFVADGNAGIDNIRYKLNSKKELEYLKWFKNEIKSSKKSSTDEIPVTPALNDTEDIGQALNNILARSYPSFHKDTPSTPSLDGPTLAESVQQAQSGAKEAEKQAEPVPESKEQEPVIKNPFSDKANKSTEKKEAGGDLNTFIKKCEIMIRHNAEVELPLNITDVETKDGQEDPEIEFTDTDLFFISCLEKMAISPRNVKTPYHQLCHDSILTPLRNLNSSSKSKASMTNTFINPKQEAAYLLVTLGIWQRHSPLSFERFVRENAPISILDGHAHDETGVVDKAFNESKIWSKHILENRLENQEVISTRDKKLLIYLVESHDSALPDIADDLVLPGSMKKRKAWVGLLFSRQGPQYVDSLKEIRQPTTTPVFVCDDTTAHELDDGISIELRKEAVGKEDFDVSDYWLHVHIADPTALLNASHPLSLLAQYRGSSCYFPHKHHQMLPDIDEVFNLQSGARALTFSARIDSKGEIVDYKITPSVLDDVRKVNYDDVDKVLSWDNIFGVRQESGAPTLTPWAKQTLKSKAPLDLLSEEIRTSSPIINADREHIPDNITTGDMTSQLLLIQKLTSLHLNSRIANGAIFSDNAASNIHVDPYGSSSPNQKTTVHQNPYKMTHLSPARTTVSESMIIAGRVAAKYCMEHKIPVPYRGQACISNYSTNSSGIGELGISSLISKVRTTPSAVPSGLSYENLRQKVLDSRDPISGVVPFFEFKDFLPYIPSATIDLRPIQHSAMGIPGLNPLEDAGKHTETTSQMYGYVKVTSPLRRYSDMLVHWHIKNQLIKDHLPNAFANRNNEFSSERLRELIPLLNNREFSANRISKFVYAHWMTEWCYRREIINTRIGQDPVLNGDGIAKFDEHLGIGLPAVDENRRLEIFKSEYRSNSSVTPPMYTCMITEMRDDILKKPYKAIAAELGVQVNINGYKNYDLGQVVRCVVNKIDFQYGAVTMDEVVEELRV